MWEEVAAVRWYHSIDLGGGVVTPGIDQPGDRLPLLGLPERLDGKTVLDIGAWNGAFSFEAERRGAARVLATDSFAWQGEGMRTRAGFDLARRALGSRVEDLEIDVMELSPERVGGTFDVVLFLGVLYHLRHPLLALERVRSVTGGLLILETHVDLVQLRRPMAAFYPGTELEGDHTNWWGPNPAAVEAMLRAAGFTHAETVSRNDLAYRAGRAARRLGTVARDRVRGRRTPLATATQGRAVFHARP